MKNDKLEVNSILQKISNITLENKKKTEEILKIQKDYDEKTILVNLLEAEVNKLKSENSKTLQFNTVLQNEKNDLENKIRMMENRNLILKRENALYNKIVNGFLERTDTKKRKINVILSKLINYNIVSVNFTNWIKEELSKL